MDAVLHIENLNTVFHTNEGTVHAVCNANLKLYRGEIFGLIGETGCGKSVLGLSILRLLPGNTASTGRIWFEGRNILSMRSEEIRLLRGRKLALMPQNPSEALNPLMKNGKQIAEAVRLNRKLAKSGCREVTAGILKNLGFSNPEQCMGEYPHALSGGMKQRVLAAMGISGNPDLLIADEPTKGLDAHTRGQVSVLLKRLAAVTGAAVLLITHDLKLASRLCDRLAVMYAGEIIETGPAEDLFTKTAHPYLQALIASQPRNDLFVLNGTGPSLIDLPAGCRFYDRCAGALPECMQCHPEVRSLYAGHEVRCLKK